jgi:uncharacterized protein YqeY
VSIFETVSAQMTEALRARDAPRLAALRNVRAAFVNELKRAGAEQLDDEACIAILRRLEKQRRESIEAFEGAGREEKAAAERAELAVIQGFLPGLADEETTRRWVGEAIETSGAKGPKDVGRVMGALMKSHKGEIDGAMARRIAGDLLAG